MKNYFVKMDKNHTCYIRTEGGSLCEAKCDQSLLLGMYTGSVILYIRLHFGKLAPLNAF